MDRIIPDKRLVILSGGRCVWDDWYEIRGHPHDIMAVNDIGMHIPGVVDHWYSNDAEMLRRWNLARRPGEPECRSLHTNNAAGVGVSGMRVWPDFVSGNSAVNAACVGLALGYQDIVVCGAPCDNTGWYFSPPWCVSSYNNQYQLDEWKRNRAVFGGRVRFVSGRIREIFDGPASNRILY